MRKACQSKGLSPWRDVYLCACPLRRASWDEALDRAASGLQATIDRHGPTAFGLFSCSKATNEMNFVAQKFARAAVGSNNVDSCNRT